MPKKNSETDIFLKINMCDGDKTKCWEWKTNAKGGGRDNRPYFDFDNKKHLAYRFVYALVYGTIPKDKVVRHKCDNQRCCNPYHLELGTQQENIQDKVDRERTGLPKKVVQSIRKSTLSDKECSLIFGQTIDNIRAIRNYKSYKHID